MKSEQRDEVRHIHRCALILVASMATLVPLRIVAAPAADPPGLVVQTTEGAVRGIAGSAVQEFLGIQYAQPPVGALRFAPPVPPSQHAGVLDASKFGASCPQPDSAFSIEGNNSEDCLFLNVYTPATTGHRPVMVWIHGGAWVLGAGAQYDPTPLVRQGVVVVTINYRLGLFGFLAHPALTAGSTAHASGNYGLMDQVAALRWVRANIRNFGGDPGNVTIFGQSAGGMSVFAALMNPQARGLFHKAIIQSGTRSLIQPTLAEAEATGVKVAGALGCPGAGSESAKCLRALSAERITALETSGSTKIGTQIGPNLRPDDFPIALTEGLREGKFNHVPVMLGGTQDEGRFFTAIDLARGQDKPLTAAAYVARIAATLHVSTAIADRVAAEYPIHDYGRADYALSAIRTDGGPVCKGLVEMGYMSRFVPTYGYEFADKHAPILPLNPKPFPVPQGFQLGAAHLAELQYLFAPPSWSGTRVSDWLTHDQLRLANEMVAYWTNFAKSGNPNHPIATVAVWPPYTTESGPFMQFYSHAPHPTDNLAIEHKCGFWAQYGNT